MNRDIKIHNKTEFNNKSKTSFPITTSVSFPGFQDGSTYINP
jgi:hypothetical protein